ncbi:hypothetical protein [Promicromonospora sp. NFX87]|uniref:hypothetical protein n=1 Tax=Promicromonospora sp. NFX87 TaxID=3402691 RepID=UPI003AFAE512
MPETSVNDPLRAILEETAELLDGPLRQAVWAAEEIAKAIERHPAESDILFHGFTLLAPTHKLMATEVVYRAHCRELLERLAAGGDTRPGTAAEVCCACCETSLVTPLKSSAVGLYFRMWGAAGLPPIPEFAKLGEHHEALEQSAIDELERNSRRAMARKERTLGGITCTGQHNGENVQCKYAGT